VSQRSLFTLCFGCALTIGIAVLSPLTAEESSTAQSQGSGEAHQLAYKFKPGQIVRYETIQNSRFVSKFSGNEETATNKTETRKAYRVKKVNADGSAELETVIEWVRMKADFGDGAVPTEFDSKDPGAKSQAKFQNVLRIIGKAQPAVLVGSNGKVFKVNAPASSETASLQGVQLKKEDLDFLTVLPGQPVKVGEAWSEKSEIKVVVEDNLKKTVELKLTYELKKVEGDLATIAFQTSVLTPVRDKNIAIQLIEKETSGTIVFDKAIGAVISRTRSSDKSVINPAGSNTAMHSTTHLLERIITETAEISDVPTGAAKQ
jgi:hypothetical protein